MDRLLRRPTTPRIIEWPPGTAGSARAETQKPVTRRQVPCTPAFGSLSLSMCCEKPPSLATPTAASCGACLLAVCCSMKRGSICTRPRLRHRLDKPEGSSTDKTTAHNTVTATRDCIGACKIYAMRCLSFKGCSGKFRYFFSEDLLRILRILPRNTIHVFDRISISSMISGNLLS